MTDPDITLNAREWKVSATETISTGEYESYKPHVAVEGTIPEHESELTPERRTELTARLLSLHADVREVVERSAENRVRLPEERDYGIPANGGDSSGH